MALLSSCWLIIECFIIPDGFVKWFYLSFYIHPFFLVFCQIFLWLRWPTYIILFLPYKFTCYLYSLGCISFRRFIIIIRSYTGYRSRDTEVVYDVPEHRNIPRLIVRNEQNQIVDMYSTATSVAVFVQSNYEVSASEISKIGFVEVNYESSEELGDADVDEVSSSGEEEGLSSGDGFSTSPPRDVEMNLHLPSLSDCSSNLIVEQELIDNREGADEELIDAFYKNYTERMRWFDLLNHDRAFAFSTIQSKQSSKDIISIESEEEGDMSWAKMAKKRMVNSLENDFEMVYVAQSCLTWEALYYQQQKVESLIECPSSTSTSTSTSPIPSGAFHYNSSVAGKFQKFKILLERFMEDERFGGKRYWNYVQKRSSLNSLLQVPDISEGSYIEEEKEGRKGEAIRATEMLKAIEKCIKTFCLFLQTEKRKQWWKANSLLWTSTRPPLEDPRNLKLLHDLIKTLQQKELRLKDLKGKKRCWWRRTVNPLEETQKKEMLFTTIEMKLVSRVLSMSMISTLQLNWCQEKLNNIDFKEGKVIRSCSIGTLFPSS